MSTVDKLVFLQRKVKTFYEGLVLLVAEIDSFALLEGEYDPLRIKDKVPWIVTTRGKKSWDALVKVTFTEIFEVIYPSRDQRSSK